MNAPVEEYTPNISSRMRRNVVWMAVVGVMMWVVTPVSWLFVGSRIKIATDNISLALGVMMLGAIVTIALLIKLLGILNDKYYDEYEELNDLPMERSPLEPILVLSAIIAIGAFMAYFMLAGGNVSSTFTQG
jgi:uncharacterized membrane protein